jgi:hypothetical protein
MLLDLHFHHATMAAEDLRIVLGGSGVNFDKPPARIKARNRRNEAIEIEDVEIVEFLTVFALWRGMRIAA